MIGLFVQAISGSNPATNVVQWNEEEHRRTDATAVCAFTEFKDIWADISKKLHFEALDTSPSGNQRTVGLWDFRLSDSALTRSRSLLICLFSLMT